MLIRHPDIERAYIREKQGSAETSHNTLIVETRLVNPATGDQRDYSKWTELQSYLTQIASNDLAGLHSIELKESI